MYSITDLVNMALKQIKVREIISLDDETVEAKGAKQTLPIVLETLLGGLLKFVGFCRNWTRIASTRSMRPESLCMRMSIYILMML